MHSEQSDVRAIRKICNLGSRIALDCPELFDLALRPYRVLFDDIDSMRDVVGNNRSRIDFYYILGGIRRKC